jgi:hypothetical protein
MDAPFEGCADIDKDVAMKTTAAKVPKRERNIVLLSDSRPSAASPLLQMRIRHYRDK